MYKKATGVVGNEWLDLNPDGVTCPQCGDLLTNGQVYSGTKCCCMSCTNRYRYNNNSEFREKFRKAMKEFNDKNWANPEYRARQSKILAEQSILNATDPVRLLHHREATRVRNGKMYLDYNLLNVPKDKEVVPIFKLVTDARKLLNIPYRYILSDPYELMKQNMIARNKDYDYQAKCKRGHFISRHRDKSEASFYYATIEENSDVYKIGATVDIENRFWQFSSYSNYEYSEEFVPLRTGSIHEIAELEYQVKLKYCLRNFELGSEFIPKANLEEVKEFVKNFKYE